MYKHMQVGKYAGMQVCVHACVHPQDCKIVPCVTLGEICVTSAVRPARPQNTRQLLKMTYVIQTRMFYSTVTNFQLPVFTQMMYSIQKPTRPGRVSQLPATRPADGPRPCIAL